MSIFFRKIFLFLPLFIVGASLYAQNIDYNPEFVDTFLVKNAHSLRTRLLPVVPSITAIVIRLSKTVSYREIPVV